MDRTYRIVKAVARACLRLYPRRFRGQPSLEGAHLGVLVHEVTPPEARE